MSNDDDESKNESKNDSKNTNVSKDTKIEDKINARFESDYIGVFILDERKFVVLANVKHKNGFELEIPRCANIKGGTRNFKELFSQLISNMFIEPIDNLSDLLSDNFNTISSQIKPKELNGQTVICETVILPIDAVLDDVMLVQLKVHDISLTCVPFHSIYDSTEDTILFRGTTYILGSYLKAFRDFLKKELSLPQTFNNNTNNINHINHASNTGISSHVSMNQNNQTSGSSGGGNSGSGSGNNAFAEIMKLREDRAQLSTILTQLKLKLLGNGRITSTTKSVEEAKVLSTRNKRKASKTKSKNDGDDVDGSLIDDDLTNIVGINHGGASSSLSSGMGVSVADFSELLTVDFVPKHESDKKIYEYSERLKKYDKTVADMQTNLASANKLLESAKNELGEMKKKASEENIGVKDKMITKLWCDYAKFSSFLPKSYKTLDEFMGEFTAPENVFTADELKQYKNINHEKERVLFCAKCKKYTHHKKCGGCNSFHEGDNPKCSTNNDHGLLVILSADDLKKLIKASEEKISDASNSGLQKQENEIVAKYEKTQAEKDKALDDEETAKLDKIRVILNELIGHEDFKNWVIRFFRKVQVDVLRKSKGLKTATDLGLHTIFYGSPGTGKTLFAQYLGKVFHQVGLLPEDKFIITNRAGLVGEYIGHTEAKTTAVLKNALGGVLFIDEAYALNPKTSEKDYGHQAIATIIDFMENNRDKIMIIFAGYPTEMEEFLSINPGLRSRIPNNFSFPDYSPDELFRIMNEFEMNKKGYKIEEELYPIVKQLLSSKNLNGREIRNIVDQLVLEHGDRLGGLAPSVRQKLTNLELTTITKADYDKAIVKYLENREKFVKGQKKSESSNSFADYANNIQFFKPPPK